MAAEVVSFTSMSFDEVDEQLTLDRYNDLCRFWKRHPPMQVLLAGYVGFKGEGEPAPVLKEGEVEEMDEESMSALASMFGLPVRPPKKE